METCLGPRVISLIIDGLMQDCSNSIANTVEILQSYTKPLTYPIELQIFR